MNKRLKKYLPILIRKQLNLLFFFSRKKALKKAFNLSCTPGKGKILPEQEYFLEEAEDETIIINDLEIQTYRWSGTGETVLLVHGWESNTYRWNRLIKKLQKAQYNVIAFDAPAHGNSSGKIFNIPLHADCLEKIVKLYRPNHIIGHSVGGMTTIFYQHKFQNKELEKLVILAPPSELSAIMDTYKKTLGLSDRFMTALDQFHYEKFGYHFNDFSMAEFVKKINTTGLLIHDWHDDIAPYTAAEAINKAWKNATFITTENYGHSLFFDEVDNMIVDFLKD